MDSRPYRAFVAFFASALLVLAGLLASGILPLGAPINPVGTVPVSAEATGNFDQLVVVLMENKNLNEVYGPAPYMTQLADQYSFSQGWSSITNPSQPNYIAIMGASTFGVGGDGNHPNLNHPTLVDLIETSGHTWNAIAEGSGSGCSINPDRGEDHFPFLSYTTITGNPARCANLHSGGPATKLASKSTASYSHYSLANLLEDVWGGGSLGQGDVNAASPLEFFNAGGPPPPLSVDFSYAPAQPAITQTVTFTATPNSGTGPYTFAWDFGDGATGNGNPATHVFTTQNTYTVGVTTTDSAGAFSATMVFHGIVDHTEYIRAQFAATANSLASTSPVVAQAIQLAPAPPPPPSFSVDFTFAPSSPVVGQTVTFTATTVGGTAPYTYSWNFGDGTTAAGSTATHAYASASTYTVQVTASDSAAHTATKSKSVVATASAPPPPPGGPVAQFAFAPTSPQVDAMVTFDASASTSSNGVLQARWDWEEDGVWDTAWSATLSASHAFLATGTYSIRLEVRDAAGLSDFIARSVIVIGSQGGGTPDAPNSFGFLGPLEGNPLTIPVLGLVFLLFGVAAIRRRLVRTERVRGRYPQAAVEAAGQDDAWDM